jgi:2',3'-cyclic-nucleotide 2'-phosphodiesterase/3'-nucleotidase
MGYDAATIGNHDIEAGHPVYDRLKDEFKFPWLAANAVSKKSGKPYFKPYYIIEKDGVKIAVLGMITPAIPKWLPEKIYQGIQFEDMIESAKKWVEKIIKEEQPDLLIGLFHSGVESDYNGQQATTEFNENASRLVAEQVPGFDVVFVGHDHHGWNENVKNWAGKEVLIVGPTSKAYDVAVANIDLTLHKTTNHYQKNIGGEIVEMKNFEPDPAFIKEFQPAFDEVKDFVSRPIGSFTETISTRDALFGDSKFTDLIHEIQLEITEADISFAAPLSFDSQINKGEVFVRDMFKLYKFENLLYTMELGGQEIKDYLEYSCNLWYNQMSGENDHLLKFKIDSLGHLQKSPRDNTYMLENAYYNFDSGEGIIYMVDLQESFGEKVTIISMADGSPFDLNKTYKVAVNSYRGNGGGNHLTTGAKIRPELLKDRIVNSTDKDLRFYLMKWIEDKGTITPKLANNWHVIPELWWKKGKEKDFPLLYGNEKQAPKGLILKE